MPPDTRIEADTQRHIVNPGVDALAQICDFIDEGDLRREKSISGIFDEFRRSPLRCDDAAALYSHIMVQTAQRRQRAIAFSADDNAIRSLKIGNRAAGTKEFRI